MFLCTFDANVLATMSLCVAASPSPFVGRCGWHLFWYEIILLKAQSSRRNHLHWGRMSQRANICITCEYVYLACAVLHKICPRVLAIRRCSSLPPSLLFSLCFCSISFLSFSLFHVENRNANICHWFDCARFCVSRFFQWLLARNRVCLCVSLYIYRERQREKFMVMVVVIIWYRPKIATFHCHCG